MTGWRRRLLVAAGSLLLGVIVGVLADTSAELILAAFGGAAGVTAIVYGTLR